MNEVQIVYLCVCWSVFACVGVSVLVCLLKNFPLTQCIRMENFQTNGNNVMISNAATS